MNDQFLTLSVEDRLAWVQLQRPCSRNALSLGLMRELTACAQALAEREDVDAVVLSGAAEVFSGGADPREDRSGGAAVFSAGADLREDRSWADDAQPLVTRRGVSAVGYRMCRAWEELPQITVVAIEGYAVGGGLALACDWRVLAAAAVRMSKETVNAVTTALHPLGGHMAHDQLALAAASSDSRAARAKALKPRA